MLPFIKMPLLFLIPTLQNNERVLACALPLRRQFRRNTIVTLRHFNAHLRESVDFEEWYKRAKVASSELFIKRIGLLGDVVRIPTTQIISPC